MSNLPPGLSPTYIGDIDDLPNPGDGRTWAKEIGGKVYLSPDMINVGHLWATDATIKARLLMNSGGHIVGEDENRNRVWYLGDDISSYDSTLAGRTGIAGKTFEDLGEDAWVGHLAFALTDKEGKIAGFDFDHYHMQSIRGQGSSRMGIDINTEEHPRLTLIDGDDKVFLGGNFAFDNEKTTTWDNSSWDADSSPFSLTGHLRNDGQSKYNHAMYHSVPSSKAGQIFQFSFDYWMQAAINDGDSEALALTEVVVKYQYGVGDEPEVLKIDITTLKAHAEYPNYGARDKSSKVMSGTIPSGCDHIQIEIHMRGHLDGDGSFTEKITIRPDATSIIGSDNFITPQGLQFTNNAGNKRCYIDREKGYLSGRNLIVENGSTGDRMKMYIQNGKLYFAHVDSNDNYINMVKAWNLNGNN
jgi:hypothetical protein